MKKRILVSLAALACLAMLGGCKFLSRTNIDFDADSISKAQQIVVQDAAGNEKTVLKGEEEIDAFISAVNVEGWRLAEVPEGLKEAGSFTSGSVRRSPPLSARRRPRRMRYAPSAYMRTEII